MTIKNLKKNEINAGESALSIKSDRETDHEEQLSSTGSSHPFLQLVVHWPALESRDVSPGKASFPSWLQVFIDHCAVCLEDLFDATRKSSATYIWRTHFCSPGALCCWSWVRRETVRQKILQRAFNGFNIQSRPLEEWRSGLQTFVTSITQRTWHKSDLKILRHDDRRLIYGRFVDPKSNFLSTEWAKDTKVMKSKLFHSSKKIKPWSASI